MKKFKLGIVLTLSIIWLVDCGPHRKKSDETIQKFNNTTGEAIAVDYMIRKYEREHKKLYNEETGDGDYLEWPALDKENLSEYCRKFLKCTVPGRKSDNVTGFKIRKVLQYEMENMSNSNIVLIHCKLLMTRLHSYYMTRAPEPNCVYAVRRANKGTRGTFTIIYKHCDIEARSLKRKITESIVDKIHHSTGQPIAKDKYLLEYELEHQKLNRTCGDNSKCIHWPHAMLHTNLDFFCQQYIGECAPGRQQEHTKSTWKIDKLQYQKLNTNEEMDVTLVTCTPKNASSISYHITNAPETNCVYALLRKSRNARSPLFIIFKHCDFENTNYQNSNSRNCNATVKNKVPKTEVKEEIYDTMETMNLFPNK